MAPLAIGYRIPAYERAAGGYYASETGGRYAAAATREIYLRSLSVTARAGGSNDWADVRVAFAKKESAAGGSGKK